MSSGIRVYPLHYLSIFTHSRLKLVQEQVAELEAKLAKLTAEFNAANHDKQEVYAAVMGVDLVSRIPVLVQWPLYTR